jgi:hypothetical protein
MNRTRSAPLHLYSYLVLLLRELAGQGVAKRSRGPAGWGGGIGEILYMRNSLEIDLDAMLPIRGSRSLFSLFFLLPRALIGYFITLFYPIN